MSDLSFAFTFVATALIAGWFWRFAHDQAWDLPTTMIGSLMIGVLTGVLGRRLEKNRRRQP